MFVVVDFGGIWCISVFTLTRLLWFACISLVSLPTVPNSGGGLSFSLLLLLILCRAASSAALSHTGFRVGGGVHDSYTFQCYFPWHRHQGGGAVAEWVRVLALNGDRTFPAGFDSHCGRL